MSLRHNFIRLVIMASYYKKRDFELNMLVLKELYNDVPPHPYYF